jgi:hypothetical protein
MRSSGEEGTEEESSTKGRAKFRWKWPSGFDGPEAIGPSSTEAWFSSSSFG